MPDKADNSVPTRLSRGSLGRAGHMDHRYICIMHESMTLEASRWNALAIRCRTGWKYGLTPYIWSITSKRLSNSHLKAPPAKCCFDRSPCVGPDGQEEHYVGHDQHNGIDGATAWMFVGHLRLDHQRQKVGEKNHQASLFRFTTRFTKSFKCSGRSTRLVEAWGGFISRGWNAVDASRSTCYI